MDSPMSASEPARLAETADFGSDAQGAARRWTAAVVLLALAGMGLVFLSTAKYGAGVSPDSVAYLDVARNLMSGKGLVFHTGEPLVWWPPLYSMLLALIGLATGLDPATFAHAVNAVLFALVIYLSARLFRAGFPLSPTYSLLGGCTVLFSVALSQVYAMAWSECLFIPLVLVYLVAVQRYREVGSVLSLTIMVLSTALACLTRYIGIALVPAGALTIMLASRVNLKMRFVRACTFAALSVAPLGLWFLRNHQLTGTFVGARGPATFPIIDNVILCGEVMLSWYTLAVPSRAVALVLLAVLTIAVVSSRIVTRRMTTSLKAVFIGQIPAVMLLVSYTMVLSVAATRDAFIESRVLSPVYVPVTLILMKFVNDLIGASRAVPKATANKVPVILVALWLCLPLVSVVRSTVGRFEDGAGSFSRKRWRESETVAYVRQMLSATDDFLVYSNGTDALWELARVNAGQLPLRTEVSLDELKGRWPIESGSVLVWFNTLGWREHFFSVRELQEVADLVEVARFSDGTVYRVSVRRDTAAPK